MQVAIVSDSHHAVERLEKLYASLEEKGITRLIHAGDFIGYGVEKVIARFPSITSYIARGNCDANSSIVSGLNELSHVQVGDVLVFDLDTMRIVVSHIPGTALGVLEKQRADVVIHGHTHQPRVEKIQNSLILNPGSLMDGDGYMILTLPSLEVDRKFNIR